MGLGDLVFSFGLQVAVNCTRGAIESSADTVRASAVIHGRWERHAFASVPTSSPFSMVKFVHLFFFAGCHYKIRIPVQEIILRWRLAQQSMGRHGGSLCRNVGILHQALIYPNSKFQIFITNLWTILFSVKF